VRRDGWLAPVGLSRGKRSRDAEVHRGGLRASDKGFLSDLDWSDYLSLLRWTARQGVKGRGAAGVVPGKLQGILQGLGIEASMWRDLVWDYKRYFGGSSCAGRPASMAADAERLGKRFHRGQRRIRECFAKAG
jgi:hypothetical protein